MADSNGKTFIATARGVLANFLGAQYSQAWEAAGFVNGSLAVPATGEERQALLFTLKDYFAAHAAQEAAPLVTSARANTLATALCNARSDVNNQLTVIADIKTRRAITVASPTDSDATLTGLPSGATVQIQVTAVNAAGSADVLNRLRPKRDSAILCLLFREWRFARFEDADSEIGAPSGASRAA